MIKKNTKAFRLRLYRELLKQRERKPQSITGFCVQIRQTIEVMYKVNFIKDIRNTQFDPFNYNTSDNYCFIILSF